MTEITLFYDRNNCKLQFTQHLRDTISTKMKNYILCKKVCLFFCRAIVWTQIDIRHQTSWTQVANLDLRIVRHWDRKSQAQEQLSSFFCRFNLLCLCICVKPEAVQPNWSRWSPKMMCCLIGADSGSLKKNNNLNTNSRWQHVLHHDLSLWLSGHCVIVTNSTKTNQHTMTGIICL